MFGHNSRRPPRRAERRTTPPSSAREFVDAAKPITGPSSDDRARRPGDGCDRQRVVVEPGRTTRRKTRGRTTRRKTRGRTARWTTRGRTPRRTTRDPARRFHGHTCMCAHLGVAARGGGDQRGLAAERRVVVVVAVWAAAGCPRVPRVDERAAAEQRVDELEVRFLCTSRWPLRSVIFSFRESTHCLKVRVPGVWRGGVGLARHRWVGVGPRAREINACVLFGVGPRARETKACVMLGVGPRARETSVRDVTRERVCDATRERVCDATRKVV